MTVWVGVDPGARWTGVAAREGTRLIGWTVLDVQVIEPGADRPGQVTLDAIEQAIAGLAVQAGAVPGFRVAVEDTVPPNSHHEGRVHITNVEPLLRAAEVVGWVERAFPGAVRVRPGSHGTAALASYAPYASQGLITPRELANARRRGSLLAPAGHNPPQCHARSAFDVAAAGAKEHQIQTARAGLAARRDAFTQRTTMPAQIGATTS
jgi:hypothetical protein